MTEPETEEKKDSPPQEQQSFWKEYGGLWRDSPIVAFVLTAIGLYALYVIYCWATMDGSGGGRILDEGQQIYYPR